MATIRDMPAGAQEHSYSRERGVHDDDPLLRDLAFNRHSINDGHHVSPYDEGRIDIGLDNLQVRLVQGLDEDAFKRTLSRAQQATIGLPSQGEPDTGDWEEMLKGGLQTALETQTIVFEVIGVARATTHQIVRSRRAAFHQQSMRASWFGARPNVRMPESIWRNPAARDAFRIAVEASHAAYRAACDADVSYQDARYILPIGTETYIMCEYTVREFLNVYAYRACSMFQWEISHVVRQMGRILASQYPWLEPYIKISCQTSERCHRCDGAGRYTGESSHEVYTCEVCGGGGKLGTGRCTFQGWEQVEDQCAFPWAKEELRTYKPEAHLITSIKSRDRHNPAGKPLCQVEVDMGERHGMVKCLTPMPCDIHGPDLSQTADHDREATPEEDARNDWLMMTPEQRQAFLDRHPSAVPPDPIRLRPVEEQDTDGDET